MTTLSVIGAGAWGTALAAVLAQARTNETVLWTRKAELAKEINRTSRNHNFLPGITLPGSIQATSVISKSGANVIFVAVPAQNFRGVVSLLARHVPSNGGIVICAKGIERDTGYLMSEIVAETIPDVACAVLSGPSFAGEVAEGLPTALTLATADRPFAEVILSALEGTSLRPYRTDDVIGAQIGGAAKNVLAIGCGIADGAGYGENVRAALITRGIAEIRRLGIACGGRGETLDGLSGTGDIVLTCTSATSRNYALGRALGEGARLEDLLAGRRTVAEGVESSLAVRNLSQKLSVEMPITEAVVAIVHEGADIRKTARALFSRPVRDESKG